MNESDGIKITVKRLVGWDEVYDSTMCTIGKRAIDGKEISSSWKQDIIQAGHSPIRDLIFSIKFGNLPRWLADELRTHSIGINPKMTTWRPDRGNVDRHEQRMDGLTTFKMNLNAQSILSISEKRLCIGCAAPEMVKLWQDVVTLLFFIEPELSTYCVPSCVHCGGCPESFSKCKHFLNFWSNIAPSDREIVMMDIKKRHEAYQTWRNNE